MNSTTWLLLAAVIVILLAIGIVRGADPRRDDNDLLLQAVQQIQFEAERDGVTWGRVLAFSAVGLAIAVIFFVGVRP